MKKTKLLMTMALFVGLGLTAGACDNNNNTHTHTYASEYSYDETYHWFAPTCGDTDEVKDKAEHTFSGDICTVCGYEKEPVGPTYKDVTITIYAGGISEYSGNHSYIWLNTSIGATAKADGSGVEWQSVRMEQDSENANKWQYTFTNIETDNNYKYNAYFGSKTAPDWANGKNTEKGSDESFAIQVTDEVYTFTQNVTFAVPTEKYSFKVTITPIVKTSADAEPEALYDTTNVYMWCSVAEAAALTKNEDGTWSYEVTDYEGTSFQATPCLGKDAIDWSYQYGAYEDGTWTQWNGYSWDVDATTTELTLTAYFKAQPEKPAATAKSVTFNKTVTNWETKGNDINLIWTTKGSFTWKGTDVNWTKLNWNDNISGYSVSLDINEGDTVYFLYYTWLSDTDERYIGADASNTSFSYKVESDIVVTNTDNFSEGAYSVTVGTNTFTAPVE